ncbi:MAG: ATP-binding protein [Saprospiraceae bacterium]|nr:ATP-binding protein [Saprospiraceae bacterium]
MKIIGRAQEKEKLDKILQSNQAEFLALYGRRRVGKTFLIRQYLKDKIVFDLSGTKEGSKKQQLNNFFGEYLTRTQGQQENTTPNSWQEAFGYLAKYLSSLHPTSSKYVVFLDEMPWMDTPKSEFVSALEFFWNQHVSRMDHVVLVACGSASSWIRKNLINARGGLYNRITHRMKLEPFNLYETEQFLQHMGVSLPQYQILELYMVMGGIPFYLKEAEKGKSSTQLIDEICFSRQGLLSEEYEQLYHSLFRNAEFHVAIVAALAAHPQGMTRGMIASYTKIAETNLSRTLEELEECDFISIHNPLLNKKKEAVYKLTDLYSLFYLKFIQDNKGAGSKIWEQLSKQSTYKAWSGYAYENIAMMHIPQIKAALGISGVYTRHSSWKFKGDDTLPGTQIDMIIDRADQIIHLCEAKFTQENYALTATYSEQLRLKKMIFKQVTQTKKAIFTTLITTYPALKNRYFLEEVDNEITMDKLFGS